MRLPIETQDKLAAIASLFGAPNERRFVRSVLEAVVSDEAEKVQWLQSLLRSNVGEQLDLPASAASPALAARAAVARKRGRGGRKRGRRT